MPKSPSGRFEIEELDYKDPEEVEKWSRGFCQKTPRESIEREYGRAETDAELASRIAATFPKATRDAALAGCSEGLKRARKR